MSAEGVLLIAFQHHLELTTLHSCSAASAPKQHSGSLSGGLAAHPTVPGQLFYAVGSNVVAMFEVRERWYEFSQRLGC